MKWSRSISVLMLLGAMALLSGCFVSDKPLVSLDDASYPFDTITYEFPGEDDRVTLVRTGDVYTAPDEGGDGKLLLKQIAKDTYVLQIEYEDDGKPGYMFAVAKLAEDRKSAKLLKPIALETDLDAASSGKHGFRRCTDDPDVFCVSSLDGYVKYALASEKPNDKSVNILALK